MVTGMPYQKAKKDHPSPDHGAKRLCRQAFLPAKGLEMTSGPSIADVWSIRSWKRQKKGRLLSLQGGAASQSARIQGGKRQKNERYTA